MRVLDNSIMCGMESARIVFRCFFLSGRSRLCSDNVPIGSLEFLGGISRQKRGLFGAIRRATRK